MEMAIGNAPWPVGVTRSGLHQRPGSAKAYVSNIAHVLNDETQRKYIQVIPSGISLRKRVSWVFLGSYADFLADFFFFFLCIGVSLHKSFIILQYK